MAARKTTGAGAGRESRVRSRAGAAEAAPTQAASEGGMGFADAVTIATTVLLIVAFVLMDKVLGDHFNVGMFFTK